MKTFVALCIVACIVAVQGGLTPEQIKKLAANKKACVDKTGVEEAQITKIRSGEEVDDAKVFAFCDCMFEASDLVTPEREIKREVVEKKAPADISKAAIDNLFSVCNSKVTEAPKEKRAYVAYVCFKKQTQGKVELLPQAA